MAQLDSRGVYAQIVALIQPGEDLVVVRVEIRDYQYRLLTRWQSSPLTGGGTQTVVDRAVDEWRGIVTSTIEGD